MSVHDTQLPSTIESRNVSRISRQLRLIIERHRPPEALFTCTASSDSPAATSADIHSHCTRIVCSLGALHWHFDGPIVTGSAFPYLKSLHLCDLSSFEPGSDRAQSAGYWEMRIKK